MRERRYLTFDMNNPRHTEALKIVSEQPDKKRSEFVIDCILKVQQEEHLEKVIRQTIIEALSGLTFPASDNSNAPSELQSTENISDLPEELVFAMEDI